MLTLIQACHVGGFSFEEAIFRCCRAAAAERIEHQPALVGAREDDAFEIDLGNLVVVPGATKVLVAFDARTRTHGSSNYVRNYVRNWGREGIDYASGYGRLRDGHTVEVDLLEAPGRARRSSVTVEGRMLPETRTYTAAKVVLAPGGDRPAEAVGR